MAYMVCEECGGYYLLGENIVEQVLCPCGGMLRCVNSKADIFSGHATKTCLNCGHPNFNEQAFCSNCGQIMKSVNKIIHQNGVLKQNQMILAGVAVFMVSFILLSAFLV